jgi:hypothetical protein
MQVVEDSIYVTCGPGQACGKDEAQPDSCAAAQPSENCVAGVANDTKVTLQATVKDLQDKKHKSGDAADPFLYALLRGEELGVKVRSPLDLSIYSASSTVERLYYYTLPVPAVFLKQQQFPSCSRTSYTDIWPHTPILHETYLLPP